jgi:hypothetical protein
MSRTLLHTVSESKFQEKSGLARVHPDNLSDLLSYYKKHGGSQPNNTLLMSAGINFQSEMNQDSFFPSGPTIFRSTYSHTLKLHI